MINQLLEAKTQRPDNSEAAFWIAISMLMMELHSSLAYVKLVPPETPIPTDEDSLAEMMVIVTKLHADITEPNNPPRLAEMLGKYIGNCLKTARIEVMTLYKVAPPAQKDLLLPLVQTITGLEAAFKKQY